MRITDAKVIICSQAATCHAKDHYRRRHPRSRRRHAQRRELAVASYLSDHVIPLLIGRDARRIEDLWQYLYKGAYWRRGPVTMASISAVDTALWDIKGKALNVPVYQLLGGASREAILVYGHASGKDIDDTVAAVAEYAKLGYKAIRAQSGIPRLDSTYGVGAAKCSMSPPKKTCPSKARGVPSCT